MSFDVIVLGGGIIGAVTAYELVRAGKKVALIEQFEPGHTHGSSHGDGRIMRLNYTEAIYMQMAMQVYPLWEALSERVGRPLFQKTGVLEYGPAGCEPIRESEANLRTHDIPYERLVAAVARERFPQYAFADETDILYQPDGAVTFATPSVMALWELAKAGGAVMFTHQRVVDINPGESSVTVVSEQGERWTAGTLVVTAGAWTGQLLSRVGVHIPLKVTQELLCYFRVKGNISHRVGDMPATVDYHTESPFYSLPQVDVPGVKTGWHHMGSEVSPDHPESDTAHLLAGAKSWVERLYPHLEREPFEVHTCLYTNTPDYHFVIDHHPDYANIVIAAGFSGHGFKFGPLLGQVLAHIAQEQKPSISLEPFAMKRFNKPEQLQKRVGA